MCRKVDNSQELLLHYSKCLWVFRTFCGFPGYLLNIFKKSCEYAKLGRWKDGKIYRVPRPLAEPFNCSTRFLDFLANSGKRRQNALKAVKRIFCTLPYEYFMLYSRIMEIYFINFYYRKQFGLLANKIGCRGCWGCWVILGNTLRRLKLLKMLGIRR